MRYEPLCTDSAFQEYVCEYANIFKKFGTGNNFWIKMEQRSKGQRDQSCNALLLLSVLLFRMQQFVVTRWTKCA